MLPLLFVALVLAEHLKHGNAAGLLPLKKPAVTGEQLTKGGTDPETIEEITPEQLFVSEGDLVVSDERNAVGRPWPVRDFLYVISPDLASRTDEIVAAMAMLSKNTCLTFHKRTAEEDYLHFKRSRGCASFLGFQGGAQSVFVGPSCTKGNIVHEILHALGFHHEHTRKDREEYITVLSHNIMPGMERNFKMHEGITFNIPYDVQSILHYGRKFFSTNGLPTIVTRKEVKGMGQRTRMTEMDIKKVRLFYNCDTVKPHMEKDPEKADANMHDVAHNVTSHLTLTSGGNQSFVSQPATTAAAERQHQRAQ